MVVSGILMNNLLRTKTMEKSSSEKKAAEEAKRAIVKKVESLLAMLETEKGIVRNAEQFRTRELEIVAETDAIAGLLVSAMISQSLSDEAVLTSSKELVKGSPDRLKNLGLRTVELQPLRGEPFKVEAQYYYRAGLSERKRKKKGALSAVNYIGDIGSS
jgi:hypothetical protein